MRTFELVASNCFDLLERDHRPSRRTVPLREDERDPLQVPTTKYSKDWVPRDAVEAVRERDVVAIIQKKTNVLKRRWKLGDNVTDYISRSRTHIGFVEGEEEWYGSDECPEFGAGIETYVVPKVGVGRSCS